jgi:two-component system cell cycle sensor histidine kinase/response regulator CckA
MIQAGILDCLQDAIFLANAETGMIVDANRAAEALCGRNLAELRALHHTDLYPPEDRESARRGFEQHARISGVGERTILHKDGRRIPVEITTNHLNDPDGKRTLIGIFRDLRERRAAQEELQRSEALARARAGEFHAIMDAVPAAIIVAHDPECRQVTGNRSAYGLVRQEPGSNLVIFGAEGVLPPDVRVSVDGLEVATSELPLRRSIATAQPVRNCELRIAFDDAPYIDLLGNVEPMFDENGSVRGAVAVFSDITQRKGAKIELRKNADILSVVLEATSEGVWDWNIQTGDAVFSPRYSTMLGYSPQEFAENYKRWKDLVHPDDVERVKQHHADHFAGRTDFSIEFRMKEKSGNWHWIHSRGLVIERDAEGRPLRMVGTHSSIQERKRAEEERERLQAQLAHAQKMECVGRLAGGIAHDFNNLMSAILLHGESAIEELSGGDSAVASVKAMRQAAERAVALTRQLMAFSHKQMLQVEVLNLNTVLAESETLIRRLIGENIKLVFTRAQSPVLVNADRGQFDQIILNLAVNSRDAMPDGGTLWMETAVVEIGDDDPRFNPEATPGTYAMLAVADTGIGMDEQTQAQIFEPFFTTKEVGKGTGLGLAVVYGIVRQGNGFIRLHSRPGQGTEFRIYLPAVREASEPTREIQPAPARGGSESILLVEDEPALRQKLFEILKAAGYKVLVASSGDEGLKMAFRDLSPLHLLLTDVVMPGLSGPQLARRIQPIRRETRVLYMSGYPDTGETVSVVKAGIAFVAKPFTKEKLLQRVRQVLEADV